MLRRMLFEETAGMFPELITRSDLEVFLPPVGGLTAYIFGKAEDLKDPSKKLAFRVHDGVLCPPPYHTASSPSLLHWV